MDFILYSFSFIFTGKGVIFSFFEMFIGWGEGLPNIIFIEGLDLSGLRIKRPSIIIQAHDRKSNEQIWGFIMVML